MKNQNRISLGLLDRATETRALFIGTTVEIVKEQLRILAKDALAISDINDDTFGGHLLYLLKVDFESLVEFATELNRLCFDRYNSDFRVEVYYY